MFSAEERDPKRQSDSLNSVPLYAFDAPYHSGLCTKRVFRWPNNAELTTHHRLQPVHTMFH